MVETDSVTISAHYRSARFSGGSTYVKVDTNLRIVPGVVNSNSKKLFTNFAKSLFGYPVELLQ